MFPHLAVHRGCNQNRRARCQRDRRQRVTSESVRQLRDHICRRRSNQEQVSLIGQSNMSGPPIFPFIVEAGRYWILGKRLESQRRDELGGVLSHYHEHLVSLL